jgi:hypothetical protein
MIPSLAAQATVNAIPGSSSEAVVERAAELGVVVARELLHAVLLLAEHQQRVAGLLGGPGA